MHIISSISGGASSAVATDRAIARYGRENVTLWIANTLAESPDLWRFVDDLMKRWGGKLIIHEEGRTPLEVCEDGNIIGNNAIAPCTFKLKIKPFRRFLLDFPKPVTVVLGLN